jgi:hypothetical protein
MREENFDVKIKKVIDNYDRLKARCGSHELLKFVDVHEDGFYYKMPKFWNRFGKGKNLETEVLDEYAEALSNAIREIDDGFKINLTDGILPNGVYY